MMNIYRPVMSHNPGILLDEKTEKCHYNVYGYQKYQLLISLEFMQSKVTLMGVQVKFC